MRIYRDIDSVPSGPRAAAVGTFDGVHRGHRNVIDHAVRARRGGTSVCVVTFDPIPMVVLRPQEAPPAITSLPIKQHLIDELGVDELVVVDFTAEFAALSAEAFCSDILAAGLGVTHVAVGRNFHFGHRARGDSRLLELKGRELGFSVDAVELVVHDDKTVSSSRIRALLLAGEIEGATELLGHSFALEGTVIAGDGRGRRWGIPTANLEVEPGVVVPADGIYAAVVGKRAAAVSVGVRPTVASASGQRTVEAHLIDFEGDLYGRSLRVEFVARLRDEERFATEQALIEQMHRDIEQARCIAVAYT